MQKNLLKISYRYRNRKKNKNILLSCDVNDRAYSKSKSIKLRMNFVNLEFGWILTISYTGLNRF